MTVDIHLYSQSEPITYENVENTYQKGDLFCIFIEGGIVKFPLQFIFRIIERY